MATSTISNYISDAINKAGLTDYLELGRDTPRKSGDTGYDGGLTLSKGVYIALSQTTSAPGYSGRAYCDYAGEGVSPVDMMPPTMPTGTSYGNFQITQFIIVKSDSATLSRRYWDTQSTGAKHIWQIYRIL